MGSDDAVDTLLNGLKDQNTGVRRSVITAIGSFKESKAFDTLFDSLFDYENFAQLRSELSKSIFAIDRDRAEEAMILIINDKKRLTDHWVALEALSELAQAK